MLEFILRPWHLIVLFLASQFNREQQRIIEYLQQERQKFVDQGKVIILVKTGNVAQEIITCAHENVVNELNDRPGTLPAREVDRVIVAGVRAEEVAQEQPASSRLEPAGAVDRFK